MTKPISKWRRSLPVLLCICLLCAGAAGIYIRYFAPNIYSETYSFFAFSQNETQDSTKIDRSMIADLRAIAKTETFRETVSAECRNKLPSLVRLRQPRDSHLVEVTVYSTSPDEALSLCNSLGQALFKQAKTTLHASHAEIWQTPTLSTVPIQRQDLKIALILFGTLMILGLLIVAIFVRAPAARDSDPRFHLLTVLQGGDSEPSRYINRFRHHQENPHPLIDCVSDELYQGILEAAKVFEGAMPSDQGIILLTTADQGKDRHSLFSVLLAQALAREEHQVLLLDLEGSGEAGNLMSLDPRLGLSELYHGRAALQKVLSPTELPQLYYIGQQSPDESLSGKRFAGWLEAFLQSSRTPFHFIVINGPYAADENLNTLIHSADSCILCARESAVKDARRAAAVFDYCGDRQLWRVVTEAKPKSFRAFINN